MAQDRNPQPADAPPPRRNRTEAVGRAAAPLSANLFGRAGFRDPTLVLRWAEIAGTEVARLCQPVKLSDSASGVLTLKAEPGAAVFLQHESRALCERINAYLGRPAVARLRFTQGAVPTRLAPKRRLPPSGEIGAADPALRFRGPDSVREALVKLARQRSRRRLPD